MNRSVLTHSGPGNAEHGAVVAAPEQHVRPFVGEMRGDAGEDVILGNEIGHLFLQSQKRAENDLEPEAGEVDPALVGRKLFHDLAAPEYLMPAIAAPPRRPWMRPYRLSPRG